MGADTHLRVLLGLGMHSWGLETCIPPGAYPSPIPALASTASAMPSAGDHRSGLCQCWAPCPPNWDGRQCLAAWSISTAQPAHTQASALLPSRGRIAARLLGGWRGTGTAMGCVFFHPKWQQETLLLHLCHHWMAWEPAASCRPPSTKRGRHPAPTIPGGAVAAAGACRKG